MKEVRFWHETPPVLVMDYGN